MQFSIVVMDNWISVERIEYSAERNDDLYKVQSYYETI